MWFRHDLLITDALRKIINHNRNKCESEMLQIIAEIMETEVLEELTFCIVDIVSMLEVRGMQAEHAHIRRILQQNWELRPSDKPKYYIGRRLTYDSRIEQISSTGRCYIITRQKLNEILLVC